MSFSLARGSASRKVCIGVLPKQAGEQRSAVEPDRKRAGHFPLDAAQLAQWKRRAGCGSALRPVPASAPHSVPDPMAEISRLRRENDRLRMERDILKKAVAIFSEPP